MKFRSRNSVAHIRSGSSNALSFRCSVYPAFPQLPVVIRKIVSTDSTVEITALLDTGADATLVPQSFLEQIQADELYATRIRSHWGEWRAVTVYVVDLVVTGENLPTIEVIADEQGDVVLPGRNVLNQLILLLDGPSQQSDVLVRRPLRL